ncbi:FkbM family methyltransferase [Azorhizobium sp. AG788]|uniref:FkbM family methyltransferase n=1 Tax=Azorhizobium sp. AG788 TaxID=2183897 RepID=UPI00313940D0
MSYQTTIIAAGRNLNIHGTVPIYLEWYKEWNSDISALYASAMDLPSGSVVLDVGANVGMFSCSLAAQRPDLRIIAVEPVPQNVECLRRNIQINGLNNVEVVHAAVSDKPGTVRVNVNGPWSVVTETGEVEVPAMSMDQFMYARPGLVKIDVEGWEPYVLAGGRTLISALRPKILMEFNTCSLLFMRHDPVALALAIWEHFDIIEHFYEEKPMGRPTWDRQILHDNVVLYGSVSDVLFRLKISHSVPSLERMIYTPDHFATLNHI